MFLSVAQDPFKLQNLRNGVIDYDNCCINQSNAEHTGIHSYLVHKTNALKNVLLIKAINEALFQKLVRFIAKFVYRRLPCMF